MRETMTLKQIADLTDKGESTIRRWIDAASAKMAGLSAKMADAKESKKPARFTLDETIAIIKAGGNETLANMLRQNAEQSSGKNAMIVQEQLLVSLNNLLEVFKKNTQEKRGVQNVLSDDEWIETKRLSEITGLRPQSLINKAYRQGWSFQIVSRGRMTYIFRIDTLPMEFQNKIKNQSVPALEDKTLFNS